MQFRALVFKPNERGQVVSIRDRDLHRILGGFPSLTVDKHDLGKVSVFINSHADKTYKEYNRGYFGTFVVIGEHSKSAHKSLDTREVNMIKRKLDLVTNFDSDNIKLKNYFTSIRLRYKEYFYRDYNIGLTNYEVVEYILGLKEEDYTFDYNLITEDIGNDKEQLDLFLKQVGLIKAREMWHEIVKDKTSNEAEKARRTFQVV